MTRRLLLLNGISILAVIFAHAAGWAFIAMTYWADRYLPAVPTNYDPAGMLSYHILLALSCLGAFAVPSFLFVSGFFVAYAARGSQGTLSYKSVWARLKVLLIPYLIWSAVIFAGDALQGEVHRPVDYVTRLFVGGAHPVYFYVPLICQFYLLAPLVVRLAKDKPVQLLLVSALLQLGALSLRYLHFFVRDMPALHTATDLLFPMYAVPFSLGIVWEFHLQRLKEALASARWGLLAAVAILAALVLLESELMLRSTGVRRGAGAGLLSTSLYAIAFIICFLTFDSVSIPFPRFLHRLGAASYGLYLLHPPVLEFLARATQRFMPNVLAYPLFFQMMLTAAAIGAVLAFVTSISRSPIRRVYRYLFG